MLQDADVAGLDWTGRLFRYCSGRIDSPDMTRPRAVIVASNAMEIGRHAVLVLCETANRMPPLWPHGSWQIKVLVVSCQSERR